MKVVEEDAVLAEALPFCVFQLCSKENSTCCHFKRLVVLIRYLFGVVVEDNNCFVNDFPILV